MKFAARSSYRKREGRGLALGLAFGLAGAFRTGAFLAGAFLAAPIFGLLLLPGGRPLGRLTGAGVSSAPGWRNCPWRQIKSPLRGYWTSRA